MKLGIFAKTYGERPLDQVFQSAARDGYRCVQFNLSCAGLPTLPEDPVPDRITREIVDAAHRQRIEIVAVSGTFNMAHPLPSARHAGLRALENVIAWAAAAEVPIVTLCSGTRDPADMWRAHPENSSPSAWEDLLATLRPALVLAEAAGVALAIEPEPANVVADATTARLLLDQIINAPLRVILDPANLARAQRPGGDRAGLAKAVSLLAAETVLVHAKDRREDGSVCPPGLGVIEFGPFLEELRQAGYHGPLVVHGVSETEAADAAKHLRYILESPERKSSDAVS